MNTARLADGLLSGDQTISLLELIASRKTGCGTDQLIVDLKARKSISVSRAHNSIEMLRIAGLVEHKQGVVKLTEYVNIVEWSDHIATWVARLIADRMKEGGVHALRVYSNGRLTINPMLVPGIEDGLNLWLVEFGVVTRSGSGSRSWSVVPDHQRIFLDAARSWNRRLRKGPSQAELERRLEKQSLDGAEAEEWVLKTEKARLAAHPLVGEIRRISIEDAAAGFDILSFSDSTSIEQNLFIEVKSYQGRRRFFWSRNEIRVAEEFADRYALYLVDRMRLNESGYGPEVIIGPYAALFLTEDNGWTISPTTYECVAEIGPS